MVCSSINHAVKGCLLKSQSLPPVISLRRNEETKTRNSLHTVTGLFIAEPGKTPVFSFQSSAASSTWGDEADWRQLRASSAASWLTAHLLAVRVRL